MVERKIIELSVDELMVDTCNIRGGTWDYDEELVQSVKHNNISLPLLVRPITTASKAKYGIVCGSRRFNAAIEASLALVPCIVQEMTDAEAMGRSLEENAMRKDIPLWQNIEWVGQMYEVLRQDSLKRGTVHKFAKMDARYDEIVRRTGLNKNKVRDYVKIALYLTEEVRGLIRPREERTQYQEERLQGILFRTQSPSKTLNLFKAKLIFEELKDFPVEKQVQVAAHILTKTNDKAKELVELVTKNLDQDDLYELEQILRKETNQLYKNVRFSKECFEALSQASLDKQKELQDLIANIVEEWLKKNFYLANIS